MAQDYPSTGPRVGTHTDHTPWEGSWQGEGRVGLGPDIQFPHGGSLPLRLGPYHWVGTPSTSSLCGDNRWGKRRKSATVRPRRISVSLTGTQDLPERDLPGVL